MDTQKDFGVCCGQLFVVGNLLETCYVIGDEIVVDAMAQKPSGIDSTACYPHLWIPASAGMTVESRE